MAEIARMTTERGNEVLFIVHRREIVEQVKRTFTAWGVNMNHCYVGMVQTVTRRLEKLKPPQLILCDEAHHSLAISYKRIFERFPEASLVGFTATPSRLSGNGMGEVYQDLILGPKVDWLIDNNYLAPFDYYAPTLIDVNKLKRDSTGDFSNKSMDDAIKVRAIFGNVLKTYKRLAENTKTIVYTHNVQSSIDTAKAFNAAGYPAEQVDGKTSVKTRSRVMNSFRTGKTLILVNAELFGEGVDVPDCQTVIMLRPTDSLTLFIQQSMRGMRYRPGKRAVIIDHVANVWRFGPPDMPRNWTLDNRKKRTRKQDDAPAIRTCPQCFAVIPGGVTVCPVCGFIQPKQVAKPQDVDETAKLKKVTTADFKMQVHHPDRRDPEQANNFEDLASIGKTRGYKPGWAYYQAKARGFKLPQKKRRA
ncbi:phage helicase [Lacticaseibacillus pantheris DSM 15945 = JCM 12539 = NBRC 106106]|uniref:Phage helicase n=2 Tax=Lacticaseibacillus pantheris TaxID=171523 RepID=A0A0R1U5T2_9LACO|nr:phage helicase [Lacticaseibacillus pantheris DSM 15945 = JCM 12539 = NBRC 106106]